MPGRRGSDMVMAAWKARLDDDQVAEIAKQFDDSPATVEKVTVHGGTGSTGATGMSLTLSYSGDDTPRCGNDIQFWLEFLRKHGGQIPDRIPIIINGIPYPEIVRVVLDFGQVETGFDAGFGR
jgi:hypothetical protein